MHRDVCLFPKEKLAICVVPHAMQRLSPVIFSSDNNYQVLLLQQFPIVFIISLFTGS